VKAVILAAGRGERLSPFTDRLPKPLLKVNGRSLIEHVLRALTEAGLTEFIIVEGYRGKALRAHIQREGLGSDIVFVHNPDYRRGNASSLLCAKEALDDEECFLLSMSDHIIEPALARAPLKEYKGESLLCIDRKPRYLIDVSEATKVLIDEEGFIRSIGKNLSEWNGVDTGVFLLNTAIFDVMLDSGLPPTLSDCMKRLIENSSLRACDVSGLFWIDVDTWDDFEYARKAVWIGSREED